MLSRVCFPWRDMFGKKPASHATEQGCRGWHVIKHLVHLVFVQLLAHQPQTRFETRSRAYDAIGVGAVSATTATTATLKPLIFGGRHAVITSKATCPTPVKATSLRRPPLRLYGPKALSTYPQIPSFRAEATFRPGEELVLAPKPRSNVRRWAL